MTDELDQARREAEQWRLGQTSAAYESGPAGAGAISGGKDDHGGISYGSYQLSSATGTLKEYLDQSSYGVQFQGLTPATPAFDAKWQELARADSGFGQDQHNFVGRSHYTAQVAALQTRGLDLSGRGMGRAGRAVEHLDAVPRCNPRHLHQSANSRPLAHASHLNVSRQPRKLVHSYCLQHEFITPHCPQQNGMVERVIRTLKEQCVHRHRFESLTHTMRTIGDWLHFYNHQRPHQVLR